ncbi:hypothetical protein D9M70_533060 [compost metagenome]
MPSARVAVMASRPSRVAGILMRTLSLLTFLYRCFASAMVPAVSQARRGSTSMDTRPSTPLVAAATGANRSQASATSVVVISKTVSSTVAPAAACSAMVAS